MRPSGSKRAPRPKPANFGSHLTPFVAPAQGAEGAGRAPPPALLTPGSEISSPFPRSTSPAMGMGGASTSSMGGGEVVELGPGRFQISDGGIVEVIKRLDSGACGDISIINLIHPQKHSSSRHSSAAVTSGSASRSASSRETSGEPPKQIVETRVMKEIAKTKKTKAERERKHFQREPCHPNIIRYSHFGLGVRSNAATHVQVQMELMDLGSLRRVLLKTEKTGSLSSLDRLLLAVNIGYQVAAGLDYFHHFHQGMHRDVKPENILVNSEGRVRLCDFDTSLEESQSAHTKCGTDLYVAPEIIFASCSDEAYVNACDVWMLGMVLFEIATGNTPFPGQTVSDLLRDPGFKFEVDYGPQSPMQKILAEAVSQAQAGLTKYERELVLAQAGAPNAGGQQQDENNAAAANYLKHCKKKVLLYKDMIAAAAELEKLFRAVLVPNPATRATTCDILLHPFFASVSRCAVENKKGPVEHELKAVGVPVDDTCVAMMDAWRGISEKCHLCEKYDKKMAQALVLSPLTDGEMKGSPKAASGPVFAMNESTTSLDGSLNSSLAASPGGTLVKPEFPFTPTKHIGTRKQLADTMKHVLHYRQKTAVDRLHDFCKEKSAVLTPLTHE